MAVLELDYMEYANDAAAQAAYVSSGGSIDPPSWDLLDEDCAGIGDWADNDVGGESSVNPAGQFKFDSGAGNWARRTGNIISTPNTFTYEIKVYHDAIGTRANSDIFSIQVHQADERFTVYFGSDGLLVKDTDSGETKVGTDLVKEGGSAEWQTWRFLVTFGAVGDGTCDVYLDDSTHNWEKVGTAIPCSDVVVLNDGDVELFQYGITTANRITHIDYVKIYDGLKLPVASLQCYSEGTIIQQGTYSLKVVASQTDSLNDTLTKTLTGADKIDLTGYTSLIIWAYALRTGTNIEVKIHDSGGTTTTISIVIASSNTWTKIEKDISAVADADKDDIDSIIAKIIEAGAANTFYLDDFHAETILAYPVSRLNKNRITGYHCFMDQYLRATREGLTPLKLPDGTVF